MTDMDPFTAQPIPGERDTYAARLAKADVPQAQVDALLAAFDALDPEAAHRVAVTATSVDDDALRVQAHADHPIPLDSPADGPEEPLPVAEDSVLDPGPVVEEPTVEPTEPAEVPAEPVKPRRSRARH